MDKFWYEYLTIHEIHELLLLTETSSVARKLIHLLEELEAQKRVPTSVMQVVSEDDVYRMEALRRFSEEHSNSGTMTTPTSLPYLKFK